MKSHPTTIAETLLPGIGPQKTRPAAESALPPERVESALLTWANIACFCLTLLLSLGFGVYLTANRVTDPFLYYDVAFVKSFQHQAQMIIPETGPFSSLSFVPGREMLMAQFANMMGISPESLQFLPLGSVIIALTLYVLFQRLLKSPPIACLMTIYLTFNLSHASALYSVFAYALALPLFFAFILIASKSFTRRDGPEILLLLLLFVGTHLIHYTITTWLILFLLGANLAILLQKRLARAGSPAALTPIHYLCLTFVIIFFTFNATIYKSFLPLIGLETLDSAVQRLFSYLSLDDTTIARSPYFFARSGAIGLIGTLALVIILIPVAIGFAGDVWKLAVKRSKDYIADSRLPLMWGIILMGLVDSMSYAVRGSISTKSFSIVFPLLALLYVRRTGKRGLYYGLAIVLVLTSIAKIGIFYANSYIISAKPTNSSYQTTALSASWLESHMTRPTYTMLADLNLYGKYLVTSVDRAHQPIVQGYTLDRFERIVGASAAASNETSDIVAIDLESSEPTIGFVWRLFDPLRDYAAELRRNPTLNIIYDDGSIWLGKRVKE